MKAEIAASIRSTGKYKSVKVWKIDASDTDPFTGKTTLWIEVEAIKVPPKKRRKK